MQSNDSLPWSEGAQRYHSLDVLRGSLMLLGILFHCALAYDSVAGSEYKAWPTSDVLAYLVVGSHAFRMPLFFILAGFFAALLYQRRSQARFAGNRLLRIGGPLLVGWLILVPISDAGLVFSVISYLLDTGEAFDVTWGLLKGGEFLFPDNSSHLWFLYYLLLLYAATLLVAPIVRRAASRLTPRWRSSGRIVTHWMSIPILVLPTIALLYLAPMANLETPNSFVPEPRFLALYGFFFAFGVVLYSFRDRLGAYERCAWPCLLGGVVLLVVYKLAVEQWLLDGAVTSGSTFIAISVVNAAMIWLLFFGLAGVSLRYVNREIPAVRYLADASYWCYLIHFPLAVWMPGLLWQVDWAPEAKFAVVTAVVTGVCLASYDLLVRPTVIGSVLNGRRYSSVLWTRLLRRPPVLRREPATPA